MGNSEERQTAVDSDVNAVRSNNFKKFTKSSNTDFKQKQRSSNDNQHSKDKMTDAKKARCRHCGYTNHNSEQCQLRDAKCHKCSKVGHLASICKQKKVHQVSDNQENIFSIKSISDNAMSASVQIDDVEHTFMLDSGRVFRRFHFIFLSVNSVIKN